MIGTISLATCLVYCVTNMLPLIYPECPYKTPLSSTACAIVMWMHRHPPQHNPESNDICSAQKKNACAVIRWMRQESLPRVTLEITWPAVRLITFLYRQWILLSNLEFPPEINTIGGFLKSMLRKVHVSNMILMHFFGCM